MPKNVQTTKQLYTFLMLARLCSKSFKLGFSSMWIENFQMYKLGFEEAVEPEIELSTFVGSWRKQGSSTETAASLTKGRAFDCVDHNKLWTILKEMRILDLLAYHLRNLFVCQEATVKTGQGTTNWFKVGKAGCQGCILSPCLFNLHWENIMQNAGLDEGQAGIKISRRNINNVRYADDTSLMPESE